MSEPETQALHEHIKKIRPEMLSAISVHAYGKDIYYPKVRLCDFLMTINISLYQGYLDKSDPDQIRGEERKFLRRFAGVFNKALNFRYLV